MRVGAVWVENEKSCYAGQGELKDLQVKLNPHHLIVILDVLPLSLMVDHFLTKKMILLIHP